MNNAVDPFDSADFAPERVILPWLQVLHNEDPEKAGFFIAAENAAQAEITIPGTWKMHQVRFKSGTTDRATGRFIPAYAEGFLFDSARMLIVRQGELSMSSKRSANSSETYIGRYDNKIYQAEKGNLVLKTRYLIYLLGDNNELLHQSPLQFTGKGVFGATFSQHLRDFQSELQKAYGKQRGLKFLIYGVFAVKTTSELRGEAPNTAYVTVTSDHLVPTKDNWTNLFVGYDAPLREKILADYEAFGNFDLKNQPAPAEDKTTVESTTSETINHFDYPIGDTSGIPF